VLRLTRGLHRDDDECLANPLATLPGGDGEGRRRAASNRGGGAPARRPWRGGAGVDFKRYRRLPYLVADLRSSSEASERRRRHGLVAAARSEAVAALMS
jgi:hypothetical protein